LTTESKNILATLEAASVIDQGRKLAILEKRFTTKTGSCFFKVFGKPNMKSILTSLQGHFRTGSGVYKLMFYFLFI